MQTDGIEAYRQLVPNLETALMGWRTIHQTNNSLSCYERLTLAICGYELMSEVEHLKSLGYSTVRANSIARRCLFPQWDSMESEDPSILERRKG